MTREAEAVARGLSKAQRELLLGGGPCVRHYRPGLNLVMRGLWEDEGDPFTLKGALTPLGLEVRRILQEREP